MLRMMGHGEEESTDDRVGVVSVKPCLPLPLPSFPSQSGEEVGAGYICLANHDSEAANMKLC